MTTRVQLRTAWILTAVAVGFLMPLSSQGEVILSTDFTGRTVSGKTAGNITWTTSGVLAPRDLTWVLEGGGPTNATRFDTADAQGHFAPDLNIGNEGPWSVTLTLNGTVNLEPDTTAPSSRPAAAGWRSRQIADLFFSSPLPS